MSKDPDNDLPTETQSTLPNVGRSVPVGGNGGGNGGENVLLTGGGGGEVRPDGFSWANSAMKSHRGSLAPTERISALRSLPQSMLMPCLFSISFLSAITDGSSDGSIRYNNALSNQVFSTSLLFD